VTTGRTPARELAMLPSHATVGAAYGL